LPTCVCFQAVSQDFSQHITCQPSQKRHHMREDQIQETKPVRGGMVYTIKNHRFNPITYNS